MLLTDEQILDAMETHDIIVSPFDESDLQPVSVDVHLGSEFRWYVSYEEPLRPYALDLDTRLSHLADAQEFTLEPGAFILAHTIEKVGLSASIAGWIEGKSTLGRLGIQIHATAGFIDPGFIGQLTLEVSNVNRQRSVMLTPGMPIAQVSFTRLEQPVRRAYGHKDLRSHYQFQNGATAAAQLQASEITHVT